jgi:predicted site-specific integrase-resolvase
MTSESPGALSVRPRQAAAMLGVSARTLWEWTRRGIAPAVKIGNGKKKTVLYPLSELERFLRERIEVAKGGTDDPR